MLQLNYRDGRPIYEQVRDGLRQLLVTGAIQPGEKLPSVRQLASQLAINPNTIQKAYRRMEEEGMILSLPGKGSFISDDLADMLLKQREDQRSKAKQMLQSCREMGLTKEEITQMVEEIYKEGDACSR